MNPAVNNQTNPVVLVVDDERDVADLYAAYLDGTYEVRTAYGGAEAFDQLDEKVDVVLLDRRMPGVTGDDVVARIREQKLECRVAMVTAVTPDIDVIEMGFDDYLVKPVSRDDLHDVVERLLARSTYTDQGTEYFQLASKHAALRAHNTDAELSATDDFRALESELLALDSELEATESDFEHDDFKAMFQQIEQ